MSSVVLTAALVVATPSGSSGDDARPVEPTAGGAVDAPPGFSDSVVASAQAPTALAWTPDGRMIVTSKAGQVRVGADGDGPLEVALDLSATICDQGERGLVGVAVDPAFAANQFVYVYWTRRTRGSCTTPAPSNRVTRFRLGDDNQVVPGSQTVIVDHIVSPEAHHVAGDLEFGEDGFLYVSVGDGVCALTGQRLCGPQDDNSQVHRLPHGKILRVTRQGRPAAGNPFAGDRGARRCTRPSGVPAGAGPCEEIFAWGFRNPFRFARKPGTSRFFVNDVGLNTWEEVNRLRRGANYGWNLREGFCRRDSATDCGPTRFTNPVHAYRHRDNCRSVTGGAFVPDGLWPGYDDAYLFADFACGRIFRLDQRPDGTFRRTEFLRGAEGPTHLRFGPDGSGTALYYLSFFGNEVHRVTTTTANTPPVADLRYTPDGRVVTFDGSGSSDPDADEQITRYRWDFGDGSTLTTTTPGATHTYDTEGTFTASLVVTDGRGLESAPATVEVESGEHPPTLQVSGAAMDYAVGDPIRLRLAATDQEDGALPAASITWELRRRHANHFHPYVDPTSGDDVSAAYPGPEDLRAAGASRLVLLATTTDSAGLVGRARQVLAPRTVELTFRTVPGGGRLFLQGDRVTVPARVTSWVGFRFPVRAPDQRFDGRPYVFDRWSDGGTRVHLLTTPERATTFLARFREE